MKISTVFPVEDIHQQTKRILDFPIFRKSPVLSRFLEFIVFETIQGRELQIKEYSIAIHVLHRANSFNPNVDSIVRIHAGRLRRALNDYYLSDGIYDPIVIDIPKGCYVPEFYESGTSNSPVARVPVIGHPAYKPLIAIFPFRAATRREDMQEALLVMKEQLSEELLRFHTISVIGYYSDEMQARIKENILEAGKTARADYIITGSLTCMGDHIRVIINLLMTATGEVLLSRSFDAVSLFGDCFEINDDILQNLAAFSSECSTVLCQVGEMHVA